VSGSHELMTSLPARRSCCGSDRSCLSDVTACLFPAKSLFVSFDRTWRPAQAMFVAGRCSAAANTRSGAGGRLWLLGGVGVVGWDGGEVGHGAAVEHDAA
jgi:hypothetical protein